MEQIKVCLRKMQHHYSPLKKLENLLKALSYVIYPNLANRRPARNGLHGSVDRLRNNCSTNKKLPTVDGKLAQILFLI